MSTPRSPSPTPQGPPSPSPASLGGPPTDPAPLGPPSPSPDPQQPPRLHIGQLLVQLTRVFQIELFEGLVAAGLGDARVAHTHVTAFIKAEGSRLTDLAAQARMTLPAMSELVDDLQRLGMVERRPDPSDGRAKLICLTDDGWEAMRIGHGVIAEIEANYAELLGTESFEAAADTLDRLLGRLTSAPETAIER